jgi:hypothetical protein
MTPVGDDDGGWARPRRWALLLLGVAVLAAAVVAFLGFVIAPPLVERWAESWLSQRLGRRVGITHVRVNPFALSATFEGLRVFEADGRTVFIGVPRLYVNADVASLLRRALIVRELRIESPRVRVVRSRTGREGLSEEFNWSDVWSRLAPRAAGPPGKGKSDGAGQEPPGLGVSLRNIHLANGAVTYEDRVLERRHEISALDARVPLFSTLPEDEGRDLAPAVRLRLDGARIEVGVHARRHGDAIEAKGTLRMSDVELPRLARELPRRSPFAVRSGVLDAELDWTLSRAGATTLGLEGHVRVAELSIIQSSSAERPVQLGTVTVDVHRSELHMGGERPARGKADVSFRVGRAGQGAIEGTFALEPAAADLRVRLHDLDLLPMAAAIGRALHVVVKGGALSAVGHVAVTPPARRRGRAAVRLALEGDVEITNFASVDPTEHAPLLGWRTLRASGVTFSASSSTLVIRQLGLEGLALHLVHRADKTWNVPRPAQRTARRDRTGATSVAVAQVTLRGGSFTMVDENVRPPFTVALDDVTARASGFSSREGQMAKLEGSARPAGAATFAVHGGIGVKGGRFAADLNASANEFSASRLTPYSAKYTGYAVEGGELAVTTHLRITHGQISMDNQVVATSPKVGEKVETDRSTRLPLPVTISLLENRRGVIALSVPVNGSFDDPQFHLGRAIGRALRNVVLKTIASPFTIIGKVFGRGGGEDVSHVDFRAGKATLDGSAESVVRTLAAALKERSALVFEIEGRADPERDGGRIGHDLPALAQRRATAVRDALARAAPAAAPRLRIVAPRVEKGAGSRVQLRLED